MNKSQKTLHDLMLKILPFEGFRQNDVVETNYDLELISGTVVDLTDYFLILDTFEMAIEKKCAKFISRDWQLPDLLMALDRKRKWRINLDSDYNNIMRFSDGGKIIWIDLTKSVLDQESIKEIIGVLK